MKTIKLLKNTVCGGKAVGKGDVVDASDRDAFYLVSTKKAVHFKKEPAKKSQKKD